MRVRCLIECERPRNRWPQLASSGERGVRLHRLAAAAKWLAANGSELRDLLFQTPE
jgi:hypothetical protein